MFTPYLLAVFLAAPSPAEPACAPKAIIADLPFTYSGDTCESSSTVGAYAPAPDSTACTARETDRYPGGDVVFQVHLTKDNRVGFNLDLTHFSGDQVLVLVRDCGADSESVNRTCVINSPDFIGAGEGPEAIPAAAYEAGDYFLYIDSAVDPGMPGSCGEYTLTVDGINPPELDLELDGDGPATITVGSEARGLIHRLTVRNRGPFRALGLRLSVETADFEPVCTSSGLGTIDEECANWSLETLAPGEEATLEIEYTVGTSVEDGTVIRSEVHLAGATPGRVTTEVRREWQDMVKLTLTPYGPEEVVAGSGSRNLVYRLRIYNDSEVSATEIEVSVDLTTPRGVRRDPVEEDDFDGRTWSVGTLAPRGDRWLEIPLTVRSFAAPGGIVELNARVTELGEPPDGELPAAELRTTIVSQAVLRIVQEADPTAEVIAGSGNGASNLTFTATVTNNGPSDVSDLALRSDLDLPNGGITVNEPMVDRGTFDDATRGWTIPVLPSRETATLTVPLTVGPSAPDGTTITHELALFVEAAEKDVSVETSGPLSVVVRRKVKLVIAQEASPPETVVAGSGPGNLTFTASVTNEGPSDVSDLVLSSELDYLPDDLPDGVITIDEPMMSRGTFDDATRRWTIPVLPSGGTATLTVPLTVGPSAPDGATITHELVLTEAAEEDVSVESSGPLTVSVTAETDFSLAMSSDFTDGNLIYALAVTNLGRSDSTGGVVCLNLSTDLELVASPANCRPALCGENDVPGFLCDVGPLPVGNGVDTLQVVTGVVSRASEPEIESRAEVVANETDPNPANDRASDAVAGAADLEVVLDGQLIDDPPASKYVGYVLTMTNIGPGSASGVELVNLLIGSPRDPAAPAACKARLVAEKADSIRCFVCSDEPDACKRRECTENPQRCVLCEISIAGDVAPGEIRSFEINARSIGNCLSLQDVATVTGEQIDPDLGNNTAEQTVTIPKDSDADIAVSQVVSPDPAIAGQLLTYTLTVTNNGPRKALGVTLEDILPSGVSMPEIMPDDCQGNPAGVVSCAFGSFEKDEVRTVEIEVMVKPDAESPLVNRAEGMQSNHTDPVFNNVAIEETVVLDVAPLVLPRYVVDTADPAGVTTLLSVRNVSAGMLAVDYEYFDSKGQAAGDRSVDLAGHETHSLDFRGLDLAGDENGLASGYLSVTPVGEPAGLSGEAFRIDPGNSRASGHPLLRIHPRTAPPALCRSFSIGFSNGGDFDSTDFLFFVPENPAGDDEPVVTGRVYNPEGRFVHEVGVTTADLSFERNASADLGLLARSGSVEWTFREGAVGHVAAIFKADRRFAVAVPGFCNDPDPGLGLGEEGPHLILPYFEVGEGKAAGLTTVFSVRNPTAIDANVRYEYFNAGGESLCAEEQVLARHGARTVDLGAIDLPDDCEGRLGTGYVEVTAIEPAAGTVLYGEHFRLDRQGDLASGGPLLDPRPSLVPPQLCRKWNVRFFAGGSLATDFFFFAQGAADVGVTGRVYDDQGAFHATLRPSLEGQTASIGSADLDLPVRFGTIEWTLDDEDVKGHVEAVARSNGISVMMPAVCLDP